MPDWMLGVLVIGAIVGFIYLKNKATDAAAKQLNQKVIQRGAHKEGQTLVSEYLTFRSPANRNQIRQAILNGVKVAENTPAVIADAYIASSDEDSVVFDYGNRFQTQFRAVLVLTEAEAGGTNGVWKISDWMESDGVVTGQKVMKRLIADINTALRSIDSNAVLK